MQITQRLNTVLGSVKITHPYHPLRGQSFDVIKIRKLNGFRNYSLRTTSGVISIPESWTDQQVQQKQDNNSTSPHFDVLALKELASLLQMLELKLSGNTDQRSHTLPEMPKDKS